MTIHVPAWMQGGSYTADTDRAVLQALLGGSPNSAPTPGTLVPGDLKVTQTGTPSMILDIAAGSAIINGTDVAGQGPYIFVNDAQATVTIATADATHGRLDLIVARVKDAEFAGASNTGTIEPVTGTPAASPVAPSAPTNTMILAVIEVDANATSIATAKIADARTASSLWTASRGYVTSANGSTMTGITTAVDVTGAVTSSLSLPAGRRYRVTGIMTMTGVGGVGTRRGMIFKDGSLISDPAATYLTYIAVTNGIQLAMWEAFDFTLTAGTHIYKLQASSDAFTLSITGATIRVEDIGGFLV